MTLVRSLLEALLLLRSPVEVVLLEEVEEDEVDPLREVVED